jgi:aryl-alcohol dehydrogenase-like predicted oxidoreductase
MSQRMISKRRMGTSGPEVSILGLGTMSWPGCRYGEQMVDFPSPAEATTMLASALELGVHLVDTAEGYGRGLAEQHLGLAMKALGCRDQLVVVTKTGPLFGDEQKAGRSCNLSRAHVLERTEAALRRLGTDRIDVLLAHWPDPETSMEEMMCTAQELKDAGKILHFGVSNFSNDLLAEAMRHGEVVCNQLPCSLADRSIEDGRREFCLQHGIGIMAYSPIGKGVLSGKYDDAHRLPAEDYRNHRPHFRENLERNLVFAGRIRTLAREFDTEPVAVALAWTLLLPGITVAIPGAKSPDQIRGHVLAEALIKNETASEKIRQLGIPWLASTG